jgi:hypothetical protein
MYVEFTERVPGSAVVSHENRTMPESPHVGDVVSVWIDGKLTACRVVGREWCDPTKRTERSPDVIVQVAQISQVATGGSDGEAQEETDADSK